jgi:hypothetical protein
MPKKTADGMAMILGDKGTTGKCLSDPRKESCKYRRIVAEIQPPGGEFVKFESDFDHRACLQ